MLIFWQSNKLFIYVLNYTQFSLFSPFPLMYLLNSFHVFDPNAREMKYLFLFNLQRTDLYIVIQDPAGVCKVRVFGVDVGQLYGNQVMHLRWEKTEALFWLSLKAATDRRLLGTISLVMGSLFLRRDVTTSTMASCSLGNLCSSCGTNTRPRFPFSAQAMGSGRLGSAYLRAVVAAVLDDPLHLLVDQFHAAQAGLLQAFHLLLHQQLEGNLGHKQGWTWTLGRGQQVSG